METIGSGRETEDESHRKNDEYALNTLFHDARECSDLPDMIAECTRCEFYFPFLRSDEFDPSSINF